MIKTIFKIFDWKFLLKKITVCFQKFLTSKSSVEVTEGTGVDLIKHILDATKATPAMHDIKLKLQTNMHQQLVEQGYPIHRRNKAIQLEMKTNSPHLTVKILVYPQTVFVDIGCTNEPFPYFPAGAAKLSSLLNDIRSFLCKQSLHQADIPEVGRWMMVHHHRGQDGKMTYNGEKFHITIEKATGGVSRAYSKQINGRTITRIEEIKTEKITASDLLRDMGKGKDKHE